MKKITNDQARRLSAAISNDYADESENFDRHVIYAHASLERDEERTLLVATLRTYGTYSIADERHVLQAQQEFTSLIAQFFDDENDPLELKDVSEIGEWSLSNGFFSLEFEICDEPTNKRCCEKKMSGIIESQA